MDIAIVVVLCLVGILLILAEIFLIPGVTIAGVGGVLFSVAGVYFAFSGLGSVAGVCTLVAMIIVVGILFVVLVKSRALDAISLQTDILSTVADNLPIVRTGDEGETVSRLNPVGKIRVNGFIIEARTLGEFMDEGTDIVVFSVLLGQIFVKEKV
ncbi:MAG: hypothetical protein LBS54_01605 [Dysgonamonadaceae bacterium]|jgi:membrane-bound ClpP family serine protease|nr:hypothetical protein [Dysgonamonadaceae bacterium]